MFRRWFSAVGALAAALWIFTGCSTPKEIEPLVPAADMKTATLSVKGMS